MKIVVIGHSGQLAWELGRLTTEEVEIVCLGRDKININDQPSLLQTLTDEKADSVINASAYTAVDLAETDAENAFLINAKGVGNLAEACKSLSLHLIHISTDFVFSGQGKTPYLPCAPIEPLGVYGESKAKGEQLLKATLPNNSCIIRTSWVYSTHGNNFVKTMLKLMSSKPELGIINDQIGTPTYAKGLAEACLMAAKNKVIGIHHYTDDGVASWYDFAKAIQEIAIQQGLLESAIPIKPISTEEYPTPAARPSYSVLDKTSITQALPELSLVHWRDQLKSMLDEYVME